MSNFPAPTPHERPLLEQLRAVSSSLTEAERLRLAQEWVIGAQEPASAIVLRRIKENAAYAAHDLAQPTGRY
ncbi:hypothetical protein [Palleronia caenipelagi]|uniref:Uncharacterized protein n=1 Tax=Palleronia caenipelagi TaxID=2489174 RepID=A0A547PW55_9RHOB|nr:hypothetical protein [Palleronia caenipelagi]TRD18363.1 hypothetical protein FEV53_11955 [Palleronia caenipelagi]